LSIFCLGFSFFWSFPLFVCRGDHDEKRRKGAPAGTNNQTGEKRRSYRPGLRGQSYCRVYPMTTGRHSSTRGEVCALLIRSRLQAHRPRNTVATPVAWQRAAKRGRHHRRLGQRRGDDAKRSNIRPGWKGALPHKPSIRIRDADQRADLREAFPLEGAGRQGPASLSGVGTRAGSARGRLSFLRAPSPIPKRTEKNPPVLCFRVAACSALPVT